jgi:hypothetical protein
VVARIPKSDVSISRYVYEGETMDHCAGIMMAGLDELDKLERNDE